MHLRPTVLLVGAALTLGCLSACGPGSDAAGGGVSGVGGTGAVAGTAGTVYGTPLAQADVVSVADIIANPDRYDGKPVRVEGTVTDVCSKRGCWIRLGSDAVTDTVLFKVNDGVMVFPMSARGQHALADGTAHKVVLTLEQTRERLKHEAEEAGRPFDPATVTAAAVTVRLDGIGATLR
ncbi:MAG: DUF4920 domain-containing protein [Planctomycetes bacterium]|nr:DUF4920 domain-containing protein [Planctomycetota bacterium]